MYEIAIISAVIVALYGLFKGPLIIKIMAFGNLLFLAGDLMDLAASM
jgi:hypothetical protein